MAIVSKYLDKNAAVVTKAVWDRDLSTLKVDDWILKNFENDKVKVVLRVPQMIQVNSDADPTQWHRYRITVQNIVGSDSEGRVYPKFQYALDTDATREYRTKEEALLAYNGFMVTYAGATMGKDGALVEVGNKFSPDVPTVVEGSKSAEVFGSW